MPTMTDYLAWSTSKTLQIVWPQLDPLPNQNFPDFVTVPPLTGLGPLPTLVSCLSWSLQRVPGTDGADFRHYPTLNIGGTTYTPEVLPQGLGHMRTGTLFDPGYHYSALRFASWRQDLTAGGSISITFDLLFGALPMNSGMNLDCLFTFALFRDVREQPKLEDPSDGRIGANSLVPGAGGGPLDVIVSNSWTSLSRPPIDPAPSEVIYAYAWDTHTATAAASVTGENHTGWEDAIVATHGSRASLIGLYLPVAPPELLGTISGVSVGDAGGQWVYLWSYTPKVPPAPAVVPGRLATIIG